MNNMPNVLMKVQFSQNDHWVKILLVKVVKNKPKQSFCTLNNSALNLVPRFTLLPEVGENPGYKIVLHYELMFCKDFNP